jgi:hypothetical protein
MSKGSFEITLTIEVDGKTYGKKTVITPEARSLFAGDFDGLLKEINNEMLQTILESIEGAEHE